MNKDGKLLIQFTITSIEYHAPQHVHRGRKMGSSLNIKNQTKLAHKHDYTYLFECPENTRLETYVGETARRLNERIMEHAAKDKKSHAQTFTSISSFISIS